MLDHPSDHQRVRESVPPRTQHRMPRHALPPSPLPPPIEPISKQSISRLTIFCRASHKPALFQLGRIPQDQERIKEESDPAPSVEERRHEAPQLPFRGDSVRDEDDRVGRGEVEEDRERHDEEGAKEGARYGRDFEELQRGGSVGGNEIGKGGEEGLLRPLKFR